MLRAGGICGTLYAILAIVIFTYLMIATKTSDVHGRAMKPMALSRNFTDPLRDWALEPYVEVGFAHKKPCK